MSAEAGLVTRLEWQTSRTLLHVIDADADHAKRSGPRALCGRYPQRNYEAWFGLSVTEPGVVRAASTYRLTFCVDCETALAVSAPTPT